MGSILIMARVLSWETDGGAGPRGECWYIILALELQRAWSSSGSGSSRRGQS